MKPLFLSILVIVFMQPIHSQVTIAAEPFENALSLFSISSSASRPYLTGNSVGPNVPTGVPQAAQGTYSLSSSAGVTILTTPAINTSTYNGIQLSLRVAAFATNGTNGPDQIDRVIIAQSTNGGSLYSDLVGVTGATTNDSWWSFAGTGTATATYPTATYYNAASSGFNANGYSTLTVTNLPSVPDLRIRISINCGSIERWVVDDFKMTGLLILPVHLVSFTVHAQNDKAFLEWSLAGPEDASRFELQRSKNGTVFETINSQTSHEQQTRYSYLDPAVSDDTRFYRLAMTDKAGSFNYSNIIRFSGTGITGTTLYPTVTTDKATLQTSDRKLIGTYAILATVNGQVIQRIFIKNDFESIDLGKLPKGIYLLRLANGKILKMMKQ